MLQFKVTMPECQYTLYLDYALEYGQIFTPVTTGAAHSVMQSCITTTSPFFLTSLLVLSSNFT